MSISESGSKISESIDLLTTERNSNQEALEGLKDLQRPMQMQRDIRRQVTELCGQLQEDLAGMQQKLDKLTLLLQDGADRGDNIAGVARKANKQISTDAALREAIAPAMEELGVGIFDLLKPAAGAIQTASAGTRMTVRYANLHHERFSAAQQHTSRMSQLLSRFNTTLGDASEEIAAVGPRMGEFLPDTLYPEEQCPGIGIAGTQTVINSIDSTLADLRVARDLLGG